MNTTWQSCLSEIAGAYNVPTLGCVAVVFNRILYYALGFAGTVAVFLLIYAGIKLVTSGGDAKQVGAARQIATYAIIGLIIILLSFMIIAIISYVTGVQCINTFGFNSCNNEALGHS